MSSITGRPGILLVSLALLASSAKTPTEQGVINNPKACGETSQDPECYTLLFGGVFDRRCLCTCADISSDISSSRQRYIGSSI